MTKKTKPMRRKRRKQITRIIEFLSINIGINWGKERETISRGTGREGIRGRIESNRGNDERRNFNIRKNISKSQYLKFYPHETGPDQQTATFTKLKEHMILKIQSAL